ncbi:VVA0879 family protein [Sediminibacillus terrae]|uniref:VVA0879 family protein n=1 Tax=Sediminibacillus terrae TaxID=1562106 RepID=UPI001296EA0D|nr:VVA0879 family protein [Sediminibacillus terrae]
MNKQTLAEWLEEGENTFGSHKLKWRFKCPACGHEASIEDFVEHGADPNEAHQKCIGRVNGKGTKHQKDEGFGCNWAAYGLFGTLGNGRLVIADDGKEIEVFDFAKSKEAV